MEIKRIETLAINNSNKQNKLEKTENRQKKQTNKKKNENKKVKKQIKKIPQFSKRLHYSYPQNVHDEPLAPPLLQGDHGFET